MPEHPGETELLRYLDGKLTAKRTREIEAMMDEDPSLKERAELLQRALGMEEDFRDAMRDTPYVEAERAVGESLVDTATVLFESIKKQGDTNE